MTAAKSSELFALLRPAGDGRRRIHFQVTSRQVSYYEVSTAHAGLARGDGLRDQIDIAFDLPGGAADARHYRFIIVTAFHAVVDLTVCGSVAGRVDSISH
jgi:hypothetical protein